VGVGRGFSFGSGVRIRRAASSGGTWFSCSRGGFSLCPVGSLSGRKVVYGGGFCVLRVFI